MAERLWSVSERYGKRVLHLNLASLILLFQGVVLVIYWTMISLACFFQFHCADFFPSPGYLTVFSGIYRLGIWVCVSQSGVLTVVNLGTYAASKGTVVEELRLIQLCVGMLAVMLLLLFPVLNDPNAVQSYSFQYLADACYYGFAGLQSIWLLLICAGMTGRINWKEAKLQYRWAQAVGCTGVLLTLQWTLSYTAQEGLGLNHTALGATSWLFVALFLSFPALLVQLYPSFSLLVALPEQGFTVHPI